MNFQLFCQIQFNIGIFDRQNIKQFLTNYVNNLNLIEYVKKYNNLDFTIKTIKLEKYEDIIENIETENEIEELLTVLGIEWGL